MLDKIVKYSNTFLFWSTAVATAMFFVLIILNVVTRFILKSPILGSVELSRLFFIWACFLGATICYYRNSHVAITFFVNHFPKKVSVILNLMMYTLSLIFFVVIGVKSILLVDLLWETSLPITKISQSWLYLPVPVSMLFLILFSLQFMKEQFILILNR